jgi:Tfp pilus assembly protein PilO
MVDKVFFILLFVIPIIALFVFWIRSDLKRQDQEIDDWFNLQLEDLKKVLNEKEREASRIRKLRAQRTRLYRRNSLVRNHY